jgi:nucleoside-diphosphate-sugar epimerase
MRILVTGGLGFIGARAARAAVQRGHTVTLVDDTSGAVVDHVPGTNLLLCGVETLVANADNMPWDAIIHCAAPVGGLGVVNAGMVAGRIVSATEAAIHLAAGSGAALVNVSSSEVYGAPGAYTETTPCVVPGRYSPRLGYALGKRAAENDVHTAGLDRSGVVSVRPFNVVGPGQSASKGFVLPRWCEQVHAGKPLTIFGDGTQGRAFTSVHDLAPWLVDLAEQLVAEPRDLGVVNAGNPRNMTTIRALAALVNVAAGRPGDALYFTTGQREYNDARYEEAEGTTKSPANVEKAKALGWEPTWSLGEIVRDALAATSGDATVRRSA